MTGLQAIDAAWTRLRDQLQAAVPTLDVSLHRDDHAGVCPADPPVGLRCRQFAYCQSGPPIEVGVAGRLAEQPVPVIEAVLAHELGHALLFHLGNVEHTERQADEAAELWLDLRISYDRDDVQTTAAGVRPRPARLG